MAPALAAELDDAEATLADTLAALGGVPAARVLRQPFGTATEADVLRHLEAPRKRLCELVDGFLLEKPPGFRESLLGGALGSALRGHVQPLKLGLAAGADGAVRLWPGRVRIPDVAFYTKARLPGGRIPSEPIPDLAPDLAVEVLSDSNTVGEMRLKRIDYFKAGVRLVWEIDPVARTVAVFTNPEAPDRTLTAADTLDGGEVLPGFRLPLAEFFAELDEG